MVIPVRAAAVAAWTAGALAVSACTIGGQAESEPEPAAKSSTGEASRSEASTSETSTSAAPADRTVQRAEDSCDASATIEDTQLADVLDAGEMPVTDVGRDAGVIEDLEIADDQYDGCDVLSMAVVEGTLDGQTVAFPVQFHYGQLVSDPLEFVSGPGIELEKRSDGFDVTATAADGVDGTYDYNAQVAYDDAGALSVRSRSDGGMPLETDYSDFPDIEPGTWKDRYYELPVDDGEAKCTVYASGTFCALDGVSLTTPDGIAVEAIDIDHETGEVTFGRLEDEIEDRDYETLDDGVHVIGPRPYPFEIEVDGEQMRIYLPEDAEPFTLGDGEFRAPGES